MNRENVLPLLLQLLVVGTEQAAPIFLAALGFSLAYRATHAFHFLLAVFVTLGAYCFLIFFNMPQFPIGISIIGSAALVALLGAFSQILVFERLHKRRATGYGTLLASLGLYVCYQNVLSLAVGNHPQAYPITGGHVSLLFGDISIATSLPISLATALIVGTGFFLLQTRSLLGYQLTAVFNDAELARILGVRIVLIRVLSFGLAAGIMALAGILQGYNINLTPSFGEQLFILGVVASLISRSQAVMDLAKSAIALSLLRSLVPIVVNTSWVDVFTYGLLLSIVFYRQRFSYRNTR